VNPIWPWAGSRLGEESLAWATPVCFLAFQDENQKKVDFPEKRVFDMDSEIGDGQKYLALE